MVHILQKIRNKNTYIQVSQKWRTNYLLPYRGCLNVHEKNMEKMFPTKKSIIFIIFNDNTMYTYIQDCYKVWQQLNISRMVSWKSVRFGMELRAFKFYFLQFFQFYISRYKAN
jgi:hypothetical protein